MYINIYIYIYIHICILYWLFPIPYWLFTQVFTHRFPHIFKYNPHNHRVRSHAACRGPPNHGRLLWMQPQGNHRAM